MILATGKPQRSSLRRRWGQGRASRVSILIGASEAGVCRSALPVKRPGACQGFTLIELILVMALLMIVLAVSAPSLQGFFRGRNLDSEARRIYALTSYAQSRAVSEGIPILVWFDVRQRMYGLQAASTYLPVDPKAVLFSLDRDLSMEVRNAQFMPGVMLSPFVERTLGNLPTMRFRPDGSIAETSPQSIIVLQGQSDAVAISLNTNSVRYEIMAGNPYAYRR